MPAISDFVKEFPPSFPEGKMPWEITSGLADILRSVIKSLDVDYTTNNDVGIHKTAMVEEGVVLKGPIIIGAGCFIGAHAYLRGGVYLGNNVSIGPGCEIKSSVILSHSAAAHFNFIGDSIIGSHVNMEAGAVIANHHNDRADKDIYVRYQGELVKTGVEKFGAIVGDRCKIGANAVLSPGTVLIPDSIVKRLELVEQG